MAGVYSEGIVYPLTILPNMIDDHTISYNQYHEGDDVTKILGITKYDEYAGEEPVGVSKPKKKYNKFQLFWHKIFGFPQRKKGGFTTLVSKTDETRVQNIPEVLQNKEPMTVSQKIDGMSCTATLERTFFANKFNVYSRNLRVEKDNSAYWKVVEMYDLEDRMSLMMEELNVPWLAIQGEVAGPGIQKNPLKLKDIDFFVFNIITPTGRFGNKEMVEICYRYGLATVPIMSYDYILPDTVDEILKYATGPSLINPEVLREGIVVRSQDGKHSFKAVSPEYLIRHDK
jgi:RNA ligase (TIGR02306 family)